MPQKCHWLLRHFLDSPVCVVIAVRSGENDDAKFHRFALLEGLLPQCSMGAATYWWPRHPKSYAVFPACAHHRRRAARLVRRAMLRLHLRRSDVVGRSHLPACSVGAFLGCTGGAVSVHSAFRAGTDLLWADGCGDVRRWFRGVSLGARALWRDHCCRWAPAAAAHYAARRQSSDLGFADRAHPTQRDAWVLGITAGRTFTCRDFCLSGRLAQTRTGGCGCVHAAPDAARSRNYRWRAAFARRARPSL